MIAKAQLPHFPGYQHHWVYLDHEMPVMIVVRYQLDGRKIYRQFYQLENKWIEGTCPSPYPLFGLQTLKSASPFGALIITEGEKCASALHSLGWPAIASAFGAQSPSASDWKPMRYYRRFLILRDNDKAGISFARSVSTEIRRTTPDSEIFVVNLASNHLGGDVVDWLQSTVMRGQDWDGFQPIPSNMVDPVAKALSQEIYSSQVKVEDCPQVNYKQIEALFENAPRPLKATLLPVPDFPLHVFPERIRNYIGLTSSQFSQVSDFAAVTFLSSAGGLIGRSIHLKMRAIDSWYEIGNSWAILVGLPSAKKSPIMRRILRLFKALETRASQEYAQQKKAYETSKKGGMSSAEDIIDPPIRRRYISDDVTTPKLREIMASNPRGIILRNDELKGQLERLDKHGNEGDRSFMMSCWSGLEEYSEDRMCRESLLNIPLSLTWIGCIPQTALQRYLQEAMSQSSGADGFMQRFQFVCYPDQKQKFVLAQEGVPQQLQDEMQSIWDTLDRESIGSYRYIRFKQEAQSKFDEWLVDHENDARFGNHPPYWESHLGKQAKTLASLVIILHRLEEIDNKTPLEEISPQTLEKALEVLEYFSAHARRCYESVTGATSSDAEIILNLLREKRLSPKFKAKDIYQQGLGGLSDSNRVRVALELLQDYGWIICEKIPGSTGRQSEFWHLNPRAFE